ncbi:MAG: hypothetical protein AB7F59_06750 [Bdellovibrionales bacterium]
MKSIFLSFSLVVVGLSFTACSLFQEAKTPERKEKDVPFSARNSSEPRKRILVLPFLETEKLNSPKVLENTRTSFIRAMAKSDRLVFVHPSDLSKDPSQLMVNGEYDMEEVGRLAEALGVSALIEGKIIDVKAKKTGDDVGLFRRVSATMNVSARVRMFSIKSNREIYNQVKTSTVEGSVTRFADRAPSGALLIQDQSLLAEALTKAFYGSIGQILESIEKLSWTGRVAVIEGNRIFLNAGRLSGLQVGDLLRVTAQGEQIHDPESGDFIGIAPGRMKGTLEVVSYFGTDGSIAVVHSGSGFRENDMVELY